MKYDNTNKGVLFENNYKETENDPDFKGNIDVNGTVYHLNMWHKVSKKDRAYFSLSLGWEKKDKQTKPEPIKDPLITEMPVKDDDKLPF